MKLEWLPEAARNFEDQINYVAARNLRAAVELGDAIEASVSLLTAHPEMGRRGRVAGTRELVVPGRPYVAIYRLEPDTILILRLLHGRQRWPLDGE